MPFPHFDAILQQVAPLDDIPVAVVDAGQREVLEAACAARAQSIIEPILLGSAHRSVHCWRICDRRLVTVHRFALLTSPKQ